MPNEGSLLLACSVRDSRRWFVLQLRSLGPCVLRCAWTPETHVTLEVSRANRWCGYIRISRSTPTSRLTAKKTSDVGVGDIQS